jgi:hypothetical protein
MAEAEAKASEANLGLQRIFKDTEIALSKARTNLVKATVRVKAAEATFQQLSKNGANASVRDNAAKEVKQAIQEKGAAEAAVPAAKTAWLSAQSAFNASNLGKKIKARKESSLGQYSQYTSRRGREQEDYMRRGSPSQGGAEGGYRRISKRSTKRRRNGKRSSARR